MHVNYPCKSITSQEQIKLRDFEAERRHCEEIIAKELDEINQENEEACKRKEELNRDQQEFLKRRERELQDRKLRERDFEAKKQEEWENMNASIDANRNLQLQNVMAQRKKQEIAAKNLEELRRLDEQSLSYQAAKASTELELGRSMLESLKEFDEPVKGTLRTLQEQTKYRCELDHFRNLKKVVDENRKTCDMEMDRLYLEACEKEEAKRRENAEMKRNTGLEIGKYLRDQIEAHDGEKRKVRNAEMESDRIFIEDQDRKEKCIEKAKQQMLSEFQAWKTSLASTPGLENPTNKTTHQIHVPRPINCTRWTTETQEQYGNWYQGQKFHLISRPSRNEKC
nr:hypothetical transcript [Hymenolepis microstoma]